MCATRGELATPLGSLQMAMNKTSAARALGVSVEFFDEHIAGEIKCVRRGRRRLYATKDLAQWLEDNGEKAVG